ncbi:MAG: mevalonate kinase [Anaerolineae bacterium]
MSVGTAPSKIILLGEHAVVYGSPAMAVPVSSVRARAEVSELGTDEPSVIHALDLGRSIPTGQLPGPSTDDGLVVAFHNALRLAALEPEQVHLSVRVHSRIPIARGMGSGAAVAAAIIRAIAAHYGVSVSPDRLSELVFESEKIYHGNPSGIDNSVVAYEAPVYFAKGQPIEVLSPRVPLVLLIGDTGTSSSTREAVGQVRQGYKDSPEQYETLFGRIAQCVKRARNALEQGDPEALGEAMRINQGLLRELQVSHPALEELIAAAEEAGALGAKLSGAGRGGCMIALVEPGNRQPVESALSAAGAVRVMGTVVQ